MLLVYYSYINNKLFLTMLHSNFLMYIYNYTYVIYTSKLALSANCKEKFKGVSHLDNS